MGLRRSAGWSLLDACGWSRGVLRMWISPAAAPSVSEPCTQEWGAAIEGYPQLWISCDVAPKVVWLPGQDASAGELGPWAERKKEGGSAADLTLRPGPTPMAIDDALDRGQPDAGARELGFRMQALIRAEQLGGL